MNPKVMKAMLRADMRSGMEAMFETPEWRHGAFICRVLKALRILKDTPEDMMRRYVDIQAGNIAAGWADLVKSDEVI